MFKRKANVKRDVRTRTIDQQNEPITTDGKPVPSQDVADDLAPTSSEAGPSLIAKRRKVVTTNPLLQSSTALRRPPGKGYNDEPSEADAGGDDDLYDHDGGRGSVYSSVRAGNGDVSVRGAQDDATRTNTWYDEDDDKGQDTRTGATNDDGVYRGRAAYNTFTATSEDGPSAKTKPTSKGPVRANNNVRTVTMIDYQPSVCKPYKETGVCGYGDSCIYLHDRSDYLAGWQLDKLPVTSSRQRGDLDGYGEDSVISTGKGDADQDEDLPFACLICRQRFTDPVVTKCGHYFCSACAIKRYSKTTKCFACGKQTQGIFNAATKILQRMERIREALQDNPGMEGWDQHDKNGTADDEGITQSQGEVLEGVEIGGQEADN